MKTTVSFGLVLAAAGFLALPFAAQPAEANLDPLANPWIAKGSTWHYWAGTEAPPADWMQPAFNAADWPAGPAQMGYGDGDEATVLYGNVPAAERPITAYFRQSFLVTDAAAIRNLVVSVLRDDGVVLYLNGVEVYRNNLPPGPVTSQTLANSSINHEAENQYVTVQLADGVLAQLVQGENVLAAEIHQVVAGSLDMSFDLELTPNGRVIDPPGSNSLIAKKAIWKYLDDGTDQGTVWRMPDFDDSGWVSGQGPLGYSNGNENTIVSYGPDPASKYITTYFRKTFHVADPAAVSNLVVRVMRDDGAATYLNGVQITRGNLSGSATYQTLARSSVNGTAEGKYYQANVNPALLVAGRNVLAAEVHQVVPGSADLSFDLELATVASPPSPPPLVSLTSPSAGQSFTAPARVELTASVTGGSSVLWVEFFADGKLVGRDSTAPYGVAWEPVPAGIHALHATATDSLRNVGASAPVTITVTEPQNQPPVLSLMLPREGAAFVAPAQIGLSAQAYDPDGQVVTVEFFANGSRVGFGTPVIAGNHPAASGYALVWMDAPVGQYAITARATDDRGAVAESGPRNVTVSTPGAAPVVSVATPDRVAIEGTADTARFVITRQGGDHGAPLTVYYALTGRAENGVDYQTLPTQWEIPAGAESATLEVVALADSLGEGGETVILTLQPAPSANYLIGATNSVSVFMVEPPPPVPGMNGLAALAGVAPEVGTSILSMQWRSAGVELMILGKPGQNVVVEVSTDLEEWIPMATLPNPNGIIEFTDPSASNFKRSFYRVGSE